MLPGVSPLEIVGFGLFGVLVGIIFGYFGMGSFMVTPTLLVFGYEPTVDFDEGLDRTIEFFRDD